MDLRRLEYFVAVAEHGSVTAAAAALHVAQPSLSQSIRALEREMAVELFDRRQRPLALTAAGKALLDPARKVLTDLADARAAVGCVVGLAAGWLDVAVLDPLAVDVAPAIAAFRRQHPGVPVRVHGPRDEDDLVRHVVDGRCELGVTYLPVEHPAVRVEPIGRQERYRIHGSDIRTRHSEAVVPLLLAGGGAVVAGGYARRAAAAGAVLRRFDPPVCVQVGVVSQPQHLSPAARRLETMLRAYGVDDFSSLQSR
ncbi:LysR family transcriptional regulator [Dactylosporangium aurantiacum]|uniref:LysR family transcriptional regulator n=1 Tax=Dactylosporangium aurantiacum TaxID=35754 RepID=A0A9Q9MHN8_9ACTN|nr:LysR family transcriptional regulator [Dactylosporangium aurantiacum]MDG6102952.1 LysR family transcriptional regulator [Dactylosporangium aurantiacum]UWZ52826.1 LysR family transcriptional regulator [Dactylosporangium aurantiacum]